MLKNVQAQFGLLLAVVILLAVYIGWKELRNNPEPAVQLATVAAEPVKVKTLEPIDKPAPVVVDNTTKSLLPTYKAFVINTPEEIVFAGERVSLNEPDLRERFDRELHVNANWHSNTILLIKKAHRWLPTISKILAEHGIPDDFKYLPVIESGLEEGARSPKDAIGFWQLLKGTAKDYGLEVNKNIDERYDPVKSTEAAALYLKEAYEKFGSWANVAASYNIGMRGFERRLEEQQVGSYFDMLLNEETARYFFRVASIKQIIEHPEAFGFDIPEDQMYTQPEFETVKVTKSIPDLVKFAHDHGISYKTLKRYNPWMREPELKVKKNTYYILISKDPREQFQAKK